MNDKQELLRSMAYEDVEYDQVFDRADFDTFREMMADQGYQISEQDLEDYYEYVKEAQTELNYKDASEDELRKMGVFDNLHENTVTSTLPPVLDKFLMDMAQMYCDISYDDIMKFAERATKKDLAELTALRKDLGSEFEEDDPEVQELFRAIENFVKGSLHEAAESKICVICNHEYDGYGNNAEPVAKGYCCDKCNMEKVIPARLGQAKGLKESNDTMEQTFQQFKKDVADDNIRGQFGYDWYEDMVEDAYTDALSEYKDVELEPSIQAGTGEIFAYIDGNNCGSVNDFEEECEELYELACESDTYEEFKRYVQGYIDRLVEAAREKLPDEESNLDEEISLIQQAGKLLLGDTFDFEADTVNESLDTARAKAQELRKHSDAEVVFYAYKTADGRVIELEPEELSLEEYRNRVKFIVNQFNKYSDISPRGNRYAKESDFGFYALYKRAVVEALDLDTYLRDMAQGDWETGQLFSADDFNYFKHGCADDGYEVTEADFDKYFEYVDEIRAEQPDLNENNNAKLTDEEKFEREFEKLDKKASKYELKSEKCFDKGDDEGGYYWKEVADEIRREMDMMLATRPDPIEEGMKGQYTVMGVTNNGNRVYYNADTMEWFDTAEEATIFTDHDIALDTWRVVTKNGRKLPDGFRRIFVPNYVKEALDSAKWNMGSNKLDINAEERMKLEQLALMLEDNSPNGYIYKVERTYEDFGANMEWWTLICYDRYSKDSWQVLNTKEWLDLMNGASVETIYEEVINGQYFQDKEKNLDNMNMRQLFDAMDD